MGYVVLGAWGIQAGVGILLLAGWVRHARGADAGRVVSHITLMVLYLTPWAMFVLTGVAWWAWAALAVLLVGIPFGDLVLLDRGRRVRGETGAGMSGYAVAIRALVAGQLPGRVVFHAFFAPVVFFGTLGVAIASTVGAVSGG
ncbi:hypothetical protein [Microbacterium aureliae]